MIKVTVTGFFDETFEGNDKQVFEYLKNLKLRQFAKVNEKDLKYYKSLKSCNNDNSHEHHEITKQMVYDCKMSNFRREYEKIGLKIKIEKNS